MRSDDRRRAARVRRDARPVRPDPGGLVGDARRRRADLHHPGRRSGRSISARARSTSTSSTTCSRTCTSASHPRSGRRWWIGPIGAAREPRRAAPRARLRARARRAGGARDGADRRRRPTPRAGSTCAASRRSTTSSPRARCSGTPSTSPQERRELQTHAPRARTSTSRCSTGVPVGVPRVPRRQARRDRRSRSPRTAGVFLIAGSTAPLGARPRRLPRARPRPLGRRRRARARRRSSPRRCPTRRTRS